MTYNKTLNHITVILLLLTLTATFFIILSCEDTPNGPDEPEPGRRDYVWTIDTLEAPFWLASRMWASSPEDIWITGGGGSCDEQVWHYAENQWVLDNKCFFAPDCIHGFSERNIWIGSSEGHLYQYNGGWWSQKYQYDKGADNYVTFSDIWGESPDDFYAVGAAFMGIEQLKRAFILHYNGNSWEEKYFADENSYYLEIFPSEIKNEFYLWKLKPGDAQTKEQFAIDRFGKNGIQEIYNLEFDQLNSWAQLQMVGSDVYYVIGNKIGFLSNNLFKELFTIDNPKFNYGIWGTGKNNIFISMWDGICHYNGSDFEYVYRFTDSEVRLMDAKIFNKEIVFIGNERGTYRNLVFRGKLKN